MGAVESSLGYSPVSGWGNQTVLAGKRWLVLSHWRACSVVWVGAEIYYQEIHVRDVKNQNYTHVMTLVCNFYIMLKSGFLIMPLWLK